MPDYGKITLIKDGNNSGDSALSPDQMSLAISNVSTAGFEIHNLLEDKPSKRFSYERSVPSTKPCLPVLFIHKGHAILGGSSTGKPGLWAADLEYPIHLLDHDGEIKSFSHFYVLLDHQSGADVILALAVRPFMPLLGVTHSLLGLL